VGDDPQGDAVKEARRGDGGAHRKHAHEQYPAGGGEAAQRHAGRRDTAQDPGGGETQREDALGYGIESQDRHGGHERAHRAPACGRQPGRRRREPREDNDDRGDGEAQRAEVGAAVRPRGRHEDRGCRSVGTRGHRFRRVVAGHLGAAEPLAQRSCQRQADLRLPSHEVQEAGALQPEHLGRRLRPHGGRAWPAAQQCHLAERSARPQGVDTTLVSLVRRDVHAESALDDQVERVARTTLVDHRHAGVHGHDFEMGGQLRERDAIEPGEEIHLGQDGRVLEARRLAH
jgi:hypothetical protein